MKNDIVPLTAIIGGTGLNSFCSGVDLGVQETPYGNTSASVIASGKSLQSSQYCFLARHGRPHSIAPHLINYRANIWALHALGVKRIIAVNAVGGINPLMKAGDLVLPSQLIDYTYGREHSFFDGRQAPLQHIDFSYPFSESVRRLIIDAAHGLPFSIHDGAVYAVTQGPRLETAAEIKRLANDGCDIVGMTAMPEAALARELEIDYASVCLVVNPAAGLSAQLITMAEIEKVLAGAIDKVTSLLESCLD